MIVFMESGASVDVPEAVAIRMVGLDPDGDVLVPLMAEMPGYLVPLTPCCHASGKGSESPTGVVCRACYTPVSAKYGGDEELADPIAR